MHFTEQQARSADTVYLTQPRLDDLVQHVHTCGAEALFVSYPVTCQKTGFIEKVTFKRDNAGLTWERLTPVEIVPSHPLFPFVGL